MRRGARAFAAVLAALAMTVVAGCSGAGDPRPPEPSGPSGSSATEVWRPRPGLAWQWQLDGRVDPSVDVPVYDIDGFENDAPTWPGCTAPAAR